MFGSSIAWGLDIGSAYTKIAAVKKKGAQTVIVGLGSIPTPAPAIAGGIIRNWAVTGLGLSELAESLKLKKGRLAAAVSGSQVYTRLLKMPEMDRVDLKKAAFYQASAFLPISIDEITLDIFPVRYFTDEEGPQVEIFFAAARKNQVEDLYQACKSAGMNLSSVEIEPIALYRSFQSQIDACGSAGVVNIGASRPYIALFDNGILIWLRALPTGSQAPGQYRDEIYSGEDKEIKANLKNDLGLKALDELGVEISRTLEYFKQANGREIDKIILCGGGAQVKNIDEYLSVQLNKVVELGRFNRELIISDRLESQNTDELCFKYPVAIGLALRGVT